MVTKDVNMSTDKCIDSSMAIKTLISTGDSIRSQYELVVQEWLPDDPPITIAFSTIGHGVCEYAPVASELDLARIGEVIENLFLSGEVEVKNAVATGLVEAILGEASAGRFDMSLISKHLGPETRAYCREWDEFTGCLTNGVASD